MFTLPIFTFKWPSWSISPSRELLRRATVYGCFACVYCATTMSPWGVVIVFLLNQLVRPKEPFSPLVGGLTYAVVSIFVSVLLAHSFYKTDEADRQDLMKRAKELAKVYNPVVLPIAVMVCGIKFVKHCLWSWRK